VRPNLPGPALLRRAHEQQAQEAALLIAVADREH
jgi:hypothetical protein